MVNAGCGRVVLEELRDAQGVGFVLPQPCRQRSQAPQQQPGVERGQDPAVQQQGAIEQLVDACRGRDHGSGQEIAVPAQVLGAGMDDDVGAQRQRLLAERCGPAVVDAGERAGLPRDFGQRPDIEDAKQHRARALQPDEPRVRPQRPLERGGIEIEQHVVFDAEAAEVLGELQGGAVGVVHEHDVISGMQQAEHHRADRRHP